MEKGILTKDQEKKFADFLDKLFDFKKLEGWIWNIVELGDGKLFQVSIGYLDDNFGDKLPQGLKAEAGLFVMAVIDGEKEKIQLHGTHLLNKLVDIPGLTEDAEAILIGALLEGIIAAIFNYFKL